MKVMNLTQAPAVVKKTPVTNAISKAQAPVAKIAQNVSKTAHKLNIKG